MGVDTENVVDAVGVDKATGEVVLTIVDHLPWEDAAHLQMLQAKLNRYLGFIESGELVSNCPDAAGRSVRIDVICHHNPSTVAVEFLANARSVAKTYGSDLSWRAHAT
jgi:hypothetical protein